MPAGPPHRCAAAPSATTACDGAPQVPPSALLAEAVLGQGLGGGVHVPARLLGTVVLQGFCAAGGQLTHGWGVHTHLLLLAKSQGLSVSV